MGLFDRLERALEKLIEGRLLGGFRGRIHPIEVARQLARQMGAERRIGLGHTYVPNLFTVQLNPSDFEPIVSIEREIAAEISSYLTRQVKERDFTLAGPLKIRFEPDEDVPVGTFEVAARMERDGKVLLEGEAAVSSPPAPAFSSPPAPASPSLYPPPPPSPSLLPVQPSHPALPLPSFADFVEPPVPQTFPVSPAGRAHERERPSDENTPHPWQELDPPDDATRALLLGKGGFVAGRVLPLKENVLLVGRGDDCAVFVPDPEVSKQHARLEWDGRTYVLTNLGRNGTRLNGEPVEVPSSLHNGDDISLGASSYSFRLC